MSPTDGRPGFIEIGASDPGPLGAFFAKLFGWEFSPLGDEGSGWFDTPTIKVGMHGGDPSNAMTPYFTVPDIEAAVEQVRAAGGETDERIADEEGFGKFCTCTAPGGVRFGFFEKP